MELINLGGIYTRLVTPFVDGKVDLLGLLKLIDFQILKRTEGIVLFDLTGEGYSLTMEEREEVIKRSVQHVDKKMQVLVSTGAESTHRTIEYTKQAESCGADAAIVVSPFYVRPSQLGMQRHYAEVAKNTELPVVMHNFPSRTGVLIEPKTASKLARVPNIVAVLDSSGSAEYLKQVHYEVEGTIRLLSADDFTFHKTVQVGVKGLFSVVANLIPTQMIALHEICLEKKWDDAEALFKTFEPLLRALFLETNPAPLKTALSLLGVTRDEFRPPMSELTQENLEKLKMVLKNWQAPS